jgi:phage tail-like protein
MISDPNSGRADRFLDSLPAIFQDDEFNFAGRFLLAFEQVLLGANNPLEPGLEEILGGVSDPVSGLQLVSGIHRYFDPGPGQPDGARAPQEFLDWLSGWVALSLRADINESRQRDFIARAASLYPLRGTRAGLAKAINIYTRLAPTIAEIDTPLQLGVHATIGEDTVIGGGAPHFFNVLVRLATIDIAEMKKQIEIVTAIIDMEKPAHTHYSLRVETPTLQVGVHSTIGLDSLVGGPQ